MHARTHTHTHTFNGPWSGTTRVSRYKKGKPIWILLKQETVSGSGIHWAICKSAPHSSQITTPVPHHSVCLQAACPSCHPTNSVKALKTRLNTKYKDRLHIQFQHLKLPTLKCRRLCGDMIEVFKITQYMQSRLSLKLEYYNPDCRTRGNKYKLLNHTLHMTYTKYYFLHASLIFGIAY